MCLSFTSSFLFPHLAHLSRSLFGALCLDSISPPRADGGECQCQAAVLRNLPRTLRASSRGQVLVHSCSRTIHRPSGETISTADTISRVQERVYDPCKKSSSLSESIFFVVFYRFYSLVSNRSSGARMKKKKNSTFASRGQAATYTSK